jgi:hypothetical protein
MATETLDYYREEARRIRAYAERSKFPDIKAQLMALAAEYEHLANFLEPSRWRKSA